MKDGRDRASKNGEWLSIAPYGYNKTILEMVEEKGLLAINEEETNIVRMIFSGLYIREYRHADHFK